MPYSGLSAQNKPSQKYFLHQNATPRWQHLRVCKTNNFQGCLKFKAEICNKFVASFQHTLHILCMRNISKHNYEWAQRSWRSQVNESDGEKAEVADVLGTKLEMTPPLHRSQKMSTPLEYFVIESFLTAIFKMMSEW